MPICVNRVYIINERVRQNGTSVIQIDVMVSTCCRNKNLFVFKMYLSKVHYLDKTVIIHTFVVLPIVNLDFGGPVRCNVSYNFG